MQSIKLAIAEDNSVIRNVLLQNFDMSDKVKVVIAAENGKSLLENLLKTQADIILLDINMPIMDGYETIVNLQESFPNIKVIMYSSETPSIVINYFISLGAYKFLAKNSTIDQIIDAICEVHQNPSFVPVSISA